MNETPRQTLNRRLEVVLRLGCVALCLVALASLAVALVKWNPYAAFGAASGFGTAAFLQWWHRQVVTVLKAGG
jgi:hypothetical protein